MAETHNEKRERIAKVIYEVLGEDVSNNRLDIGIKSMAFDTRIAHGHPEITLTTDDDDICLIVTLNPKE